MVSRTFRRCYPPHPGRRPGLVYLPSYRACVPAGLEGPPGVQPQRSKKRRFSGGGPAEVPVRAALAEEEAMPDLPSPDREDAHPRSGPEDCGQLGT
jgi:hypothetical protein